MKKPSLQIVRRWCSVGVLVGMSTLTQAQDTSVAAPVSQQDFSSLIAKAQLSQQGIANPTDAQVNKATADVTAMRASGMGWGAIANSLGVQLGAVVSAANRATPASDAASDTAPGKSALAASRSDRAANASANAGNSAGGQGNGGGSGGGKGGNGGGGGGGGNGGGGGGKR